MESIQKMYDNFLETDAILESYDIPNDFKLDHILDLPNTEEDDINLVHPPHITRLGTFWFICKLTYW